MNDTVTVAISSDFLDSFSKLPRKMQAKTSAFVNKFKNDPRSSGINYEKINAADKNIYSVRIDDTYRGIVMRQKDEGVYLLLWVDHHDEAYEWARRRRVAVNPTTGTLQVYETVSVAERSEQSAPGLLSHVTVSELVDLGVPEELIDYVRSIVDEAGFYAAKSIMPADVFENLSWVVNGIPVSEVLEMVYSDAEKDSDSDGDSYADALTRPDSLRSFVVVEGEDELFEILSAPLEKWRVFLHPSQRKLVRRTYNGPARVLGDAGTGKTVVAMHRAKYLAENTQAMLAASGSGNRRILFTTFSSNLSADIATNLQKICTKPEMQRIDVVNLDSWVSRFMRENELDFRIEYDEGVLESVWAEAISDSGTMLDFEPSFYADEWSQVVLAQDVQNLVSYSHAKRLGRGVRLNRRQRIEVWNVVERYRQILKSMRVRDVDFAMDECAKLVGHAHPEGLYERIIVDEGQDFSAPAYRLVRALAGSEHQNDIFIVGDAHQRIYGRRTVLSQCGIRIVGRGSKLRINYRTTDEIRRCATAVLEGIRFDDLDGGNDDSKSQSLLHGTNPEIVGFDNDADEASYVATEVERLMANEVSLKDVCIVARTNKKLRSYAHYLNQRDLPVCELKARKADDRKKDGVRLASMHRVKGLEFDHVFIVDVSKDVLPPRGVLRRKEREGGVEELIQGEKSLLYVAMTRAKKSVTISFVGEKSQILA